MKKGTDSLSPWPIPDRGLARGQHWQILLQLIIKKVTNYLFYFPPHTIILFLFSKLGLILFLLVVIRIFW